MTKNNTILDIAAAANVSTATVSRVLNASGKVRESTAKRVLKVAEKMNYQPSRVARRMRAKSVNSLIIGLIIPDMYNPFFSELSRAVEDVAYKYRHVTFVCNTDEDIQKEKFYINSMIAEKVSGLIIAPTNGDKPHMELLIDKKFPVVTIDRKTGFSDLDSCTVDSEYGAYMGVKLLVDLGHNRIGLINGIKNLSTSQDRFRGYKKALNEAGIPVLDELVHFEDFKVAGGSNAALKLLSLEKKPTAIFICNSLMTLGCITEFKKNNIRIPDDIAIIGYDEMPWSAALTPPMTTIKQPCYELGTSAAELLINKLQNPSQSPRHIVLTPQMIVRESCGKNIHVGSDPLAGSLRDN